jgi:hypothetical protein
MCLLLLDYLRGEELTKERITEKIPYFILAFVFLIIALIGKSTQISDPLIPIILAPASLLLTAQHILIPTGLTIFYPFISDVSLSNTTVLTGIFVLACTGIISVATAKRTRALSFAVVWLLVLLAPSLLNMQKGGELGIPDIYLTSDRYAYLALIGPIILIGFMLKHTSLYIGLALVVMLSALTATQVPYWHSSDQLFRRVIDSGQQSHVAYTNIGGYAAQAGKFEEAEELFTQSLSIRRTTRVLFNLAQIKAHLDKKKEAIALYQELLELTPNDKSAKSKLQLLL